MIILKSIIYKDGSILDVNYKDGSILEMNDSDWIRLARAPLIGAQSNLCPETGALYRRAISGHKLGARNRLCPGHMGAHAHTVTQGGERLPNGYKNTWI